MKNKIYSSLLVTAVALIGFFAVPAQGYSHNGNSQYTWELTYCNTPDGWSTYNCDASGPGCLDQVCHCDY